MIFENLPGLRISRGSGIHWHVKRAYSVDYASVDQPVLPCQLQGCERTPRIEMFELAVLTGFETDSWHVCIRAKTDKKFVYTDIYGGGVIFWSLRFCSDFRGKFVRICPDLSENFADLTK